jgi:hypothetical protein
MRVTMAALTAFALCATQAAGQTRPARSAPSIEGTWRVNFVVPMEAVPGVAPLEVSGEEAVRVAAVAGQAMSDEFARTLDPEVPMLVTQSDGLPIVRGRRRTRAVVEPADGRLPYTEEARKSLSAPPPPESFDNPEQRPNAERCLVGDGQPPLSSFLLDAQLKILVTRDHVVVMKEYGADVRIVPIGQPRPDKVLWGRLGASVGRWEGRTLVIETIGLPDADRVRFGPTLLVPGDATVVERLTPLSDRELLYQFTVIEPKTYAAPWLGEFSWYRTDKGFYEHACHEGNYSLPNILAGARHEEAVARAAAGR